MLYGKYFNVEIWQVSAGRAGLHKINTNCQKDTVLITNFLSLQDFFLCDDKAIKKPLLIIHHWFFLII